MTEGACMVTRSKLYPTPGRSYRFAWKWLYTVTIPGEPYTFDGDTFGWVKSLCKRKAPGLPIVYAWKAEPPTQVSGSTKKKTPAQLDAEIAEVLRAKDWNTYLAAVPRLSFKPVDNQTWGAIREEGLDQEQGAPSRDQWIVAVLPISRADADGLRRLDAATVEKLNGFDIALKRAYDGKIIDLVDYDGGLVRLVKTTSRARDFRRMRQDHATKKRISDMVRAAIEEHAIDFIQGAYRRFETVGGKEPCLSVGLITDYLRQAHMPEDFRWATKDRQRTWTRSILESMRRAGKIGSSSGVTSEGVQARCYEPKR